MYFIALVTKSKSYSRIQYDLNSCKISSKFLLSASLYKISNFSNFT